ncbi:sodium- and chloride-dependent GABA transporter 3-like isoform X2 [Astatotilapia calliptera]|uniref:sodium- and chloride-dependent GABA transporter 3-like isoform X2 n=1 Tax=Astatotilapia calliptera TaxID=8154 RepID=UPI000E413172|nr:sodium- and chloride-dependent GABA transporter 3-like isoform X2 [Astatotilapia calliptera]
MDMQSNVEKREHWSKKREYILASAGNVVGLGNVWRFPYLCYKNGGGAFLLPYLFFAVLCGMPLFLLETVIGQYTQEGTITCWTKLCPLAQGAGYSIIMIQLYSRVYSIVLAWALLYLVYCFRDPLPWATCNNSWNTDRCVDITSANQTAVHSGNATIDWKLGNLTKSSVSEFWERQVLSISAGIEEPGAVKWEVLLCLLACWVACYFSIWKGVRSAGKVVYFTAVFPYVMLAILLVRGLTLPGAWEGVVYYLYPDPSRLAELQFTGLETITSSVIDMFPGQMRRPWRREVFLIVFCLVCFIIQISLTTQGGVYLFQLTDHYAANGACILFVGLLQCGAVGWGFGAERMCDVVEDMTGHRPSVFFKLCWRYFTPLISVVCFVGFFLDYQPLTSNEGYMYPNWAYHLGWVMALSSVVVAPIWAVSKICLSKDPLRKLVIDIWSPVDAPTVRPEDIQNELEIKAVSLTEI